MIRWQILTSLEVLFTVCLSFLLAFLELHALMSKHRMHTLLMVQMV